MAAERAAAIQAGKHWRRFQKKAAKLGRFYFRSLPYKTDVPDGRVVVHNSNREADEQLRWENSGSIWRRLERKYRPSKQPPGENGFAVWHQVYNRLDDPLTVCNCGWNPRIGPHYIKGGQYPLW